MKVNELLENINNKNFNMERELQIKKYLPIEVKKTIAQGIIYDCTNNENGAIKVDSVEKHISYVRYMITMHTSLEYTDDDYDALCAVEYGDGNLLDGIIGCFGTDAKECLRILELMMDDYMHEMSIDFSVSKFLGSITVSINEITKKLNEKIQDIDIESMIPSDVDKKKLSDFVNRYIK